MWRHPLAGCPGRVSPLAEVTSPPAGYASSVIACLSPGRACARTRCDKVLSASDDVVDDEVPPSVHTVGNPRERVLSPEESAFGTVGVAIWLAAVGVVVGVAVMLFVTSVVMSELAKVEGGHHGRILLVREAVYNSRRLILLDYLLYSCILRAGVVIWLVGMVSAVGID